MHTEREHLVAENSEAPKKISEEEINLALAAKNPAPGFFEGIALMFRYFFTHCVKIPDLRTKRKSND